MAKLDCFRLSKVQMNNVRGGRTWRCSGSNVDNATAQHFIFFDYDDIEAKDEFAAGRAAKNRAGCKDCYVNCI